MLLALPLGAQARRGEDETNDQKQGERHNLFEASASTDLRNPCLCCDRRIRHNAELRHSRWKEGHDGATERRISPSRRKRKGQRLLPQVIR